MIEKWTETMGTMTTFLLGIKEGSACCMVLARASSLQSDSVPYQAFHTYPHRMLCLPTLSSLARTLEMTEKQPYQKAASVLPFIKAVAFGGLSATRSFISSNEDIATFLSSCRVHGMMWTSMLSR